MDDDIYEMDESEFGEFWDADAEMESDFYDPFEDDSEMFLGDEDWDDEIGVIDMGVEENADNTQAQLPSPLGGAAGLAGLSPRN